jgi:hypothetical protein
MGQGACVENLCGNATVPELTCCTAGLSAKMRIFFNLDFGGSMRRVFTLAILGLLGAAACDDGDISYQDACKEMAAAVCDKAFNCGSDSPVAFYTSQYESQAKCTSEEKAVCTTTDTGCDSGETYHADKAKQCVDGFTALSCSELEGDFPAGCSEVCTSSSSGSGGSGGAGSTTY